MKQNRKAPQLAPQEYISRKPAPDDSHATKHSELAHDHEQYGDKRFIIGNVVEGKNEVQYMSHVKVYYLYIAPNTAPPTNLPVTFLSYYQP